MEKQMTLGAKIKNIWDYDKWYILGGLLIVVLLVWFVKDTMFKKEPDVTILYASRGYLGDMYFNNMEGYFKELIADRDGDGEKTVTVLNFEFAPDPDAETVNKNLEKEINTKLVMETSMQENCLLVMKREFADSVFAGKGAMLTDFSEIIDGIEETYYLPIQKTVLKERFPHIPDDAVVVLKMPYKSGFERYYETAKELLKSIIIK